MKIVLYKGDTNKVTDIIEGVSNPVALPNGDLIDLVWDGGKIEGLRTCYLIAEDDVEVGEYVGNEALDSYIRQAIEKVNENVREACYRGFTSEVTGWTYETGEKDQTNFSRRLITLLSNSKGTVDWKTIDGVVRNHTREQFLAVCEELDQFITGNIGKGWVIKEKLINAKSIPEVDAISLEV